MKVSLKRVNEGAHFKAYGQSNVSIDIDGSSDVGGLDQGLRPMELILSGLASCSAMDVIHILNKQKQKIDTFNIEVEAERREDKIPKIFKSILIKFHLTGQIDTEKAIRAVQLSLEKYCSVSEMLRERVEIKHEVEVNS